MKKNVQKELKDKLYIIMPAYNEEENIENVVREWHDVVKKVGNDSKLVVINDGSKDKTFQILCKIKKKFKYLEPLNKCNEGHGATILYGYDYALKQNASYIFQTDSDDQTSPEDFWKFWEKRNEYDAIIGFRNHRQDGLMRVFVTKMLKLILFLIFKLNITDANAPFRLMNNEILKKYYKQIPEKFYLSNVILTVLMINNNEKVTFIPITFKPRQGGKNSINLKKIFVIGLQSLKDFKEIKKKIKN